MASASRWSAVRRSVESRCTVQPTSPAEAANTARATMSSVRWILNDPVGSVKSQFNDKNPTTAAASPDGKPSVPTARTATSRTSAATVRSACARRAMPATAPTVTTAAVTLIGARSARRISVDTIARMPGSGPDHASPVAAVSSPAATATAG